MIYQTAYFSSASARLDDRDVVGILEDARVKNVKLGVTGMLLLIDQVFFQVLEGEQQVVEDLIARIEKNPLHSGMIRVMTREHKERLFPGWSMGYEKLTYDALDQLQVGDVLFDIADLAKNPNMEKLAEQAPEIVIFMRSLYSSRSMDGAPSMRRPD